MRNTFVSTICPGKKKSDFSNSWIIYNLHQSPQVVHFYTIYTAYLECCLTCCLQSRNYKHVSYSKEISPIQLEAPSFSLQQAISIHRAKVILKVKEHS